MPMLRANASRQARVRSASVHASTSCRYSGGGEGFVCSHRIDFFTMSLPSDVLCDILDMAYEAETFDLVLDLNRWAKRTRLEWIKTRRRSIIDMDGLFEERFLVNSMGCLTNMPDFASYNKLWRQGFRKNPFDVEWLNYDKDDIRVNKYLGIVLETLSEQITLWGTNAETRVCLAFVYFGRFIDSLQRLYLHATDYWVLKIMDC